MAHGLLPGKERNSFGRKGLWDYVSILELFRLRGAVSTASNLCQAAFASLAIGSRPPGRAVRTGIERRAWHDGTDAQGFFPSG